MQPNLIKQNNKNYQDINIIAKLYQNINNLYQKIYYLLREIIKIITTNKQY